MYRISKRWTFDAAHHLDGLPDGHKCARVHGHTWAVEVVLAAAALTGPGFVTDFGELAPLGRYIDDTLDHRDLNEVLDVPPTSENLARHVADWFLGNLQAQVAGRLVAVRVSETPTSAAEYVLEAA
ncbi:6-carboxytetrahydropterin synthase [Micromonospora sp. Llam7]|uniref:6-pyruvoyl trahydropterin synthase family protein n=1 Tax=Micromonospora tarapacensis TaxID=2835305 RepID=UPI001C835CE8|nr:6-carboxytetrahydropterin synthase [Micromonospora tarapacensis]MBX7267526.1 6-carboxytetrahydropterin synthase [Micromonospora tarapacensis]